MCVRYEQLNQRKKYCFCYEQETMEWLPNVAKCRIVEYDKVETVFLIPYIGLPAVIFGRKLKRLLKDYYCIDVKVVFSSFKV